MALPLVFMRPNSNCLPFPGNVKSSPGCSRINSTTPINTGPQSAIVASSKISFQIKVASFRFLWHLGFGIWKRFCNL
ncbi:hypothetical protein ACFX13_023618 [Malus domestica]